MSAGATKGSAARGTSEVREDEEKTQRGGPGGFNTATCVPDGC